MDTITHNKIFSPSINILRDENAILNYIATPNATQVYSQIIYDYKIGIRAFNLVGAYGIGKSAFLKALENDLKSATQNFSRNGVLSRNVKAYESIKLVGDYSSLQSAFADNLQVPELNSATLIESLKDIYNNLEKENKGLIIFIDEFGKFLEFASKNNPESELYFIQQLSEFVNDTSKEILLITTLHQDFNQYAYGLTKSQQNEWDKVKGRLKEISFNEPVEQLLFLAAKRVNQLFSNATNDDFDSLFDVITESRLFPLKDYLNKEIATELLPFDLLSSAVLTLSLQRYGQNERSLFSFLESNDPFSLVQYNESQNPYYNLSNVYDYLIHNYYSFITGKFNPHFAHWATMRSAIERTEGFYEGDKNAAIKIVKVIGLLNIFSSASGVINPAFINLYCKYALDIHNAPVIINDLQRLKVIHYVNFSERFKISQGTDVDIEAELREAGLQIEKPNNVIQYLEEYFHFISVTAKASYYKSGTPRLFEYQLIDKPVVITPEGEIDGYIQLIFDKTLNDEDLKLVSLNSEEAIVFVLFKDILAIQNALHEILKIQKVRANNFDDKIVVNELNDMEANQIKVLNKLVLTDLYNPEKVSWFISGIQEIITSTKELNKKLSQFVERIYPYTPIYKNEMVNRTKLSTPITTARKMLMRHLTQNWDNENLGYLGNTFPPDKTIYLSLLAKTEMHSADDLGQFDIVQPSEPSFQHLWNLGNDFLSASVSIKRNLQDFVDQMLVKPFKLKQGFIDFWLPIFLFAKRNDFALFKDGIYIPELTDETLELVARQPSDFEIKAFDVTGIKLQLFNRYRSLLQQSISEDINNRSFIETIKPFLRFYAKEINEYAKQTERISIQSIRLRTAIAQSKDPEKAFFEDFPSAMGYSIIQLQKDDKKLEQYISDLQVSIKEIRFSYSHLVERFETFVSEDIVGQSLNFEDYKLELQNRFLKIKRHFLKPEQKAFIQRIYSPLDDRTAWLNSLVQVCLGKTLEKITDEEEIKLYSLFKEMIRELDNLCELSQNDFDENTEDVFKIEITSIVDGLKKNLVRLPKSKSKEVRIKEDELKKLLGNDKGVNIAILTSLLQEQLKK